MRLRLITVFLIVAIFASSLASLAIPATAAPSRQILRARLTPVAGLVQVLKTGEGTWRTINEDVEIEEGDEIRTGNSGIATLTTVVGVEIRMFPTTQIALQAYRLGEEEGSEGLLYSLDHLVGTLYVNIDGELDEDDIVEIVTPSLAAQVVGTEFFSFVSPRIAAGILVVEGLVRVLTTLSRRFEVGPGQLLYARADLPEPPPTVVTPALLNTIGTSLIEGEIDTQEELERFIQFLLDNQADEVAPETRNFFRPLFGLEPLDYSTLDPERDQQALQELFDRAAETDEFDLIPEEIIPQLIEFYLGRLQDLALGDLAELTCGNGVREAGETRFECPEEFPEITANDGNGFCETNRFDLRESLIIAPEDCFYEGLARGAIAQLRRLLGLTRGGGGPGGGGPGGGGQQPGVTLTVTPTFTPPCGSGIGNPCLNIPGNNVPGNNGLPRPQ
jgi:hypothetical protein